ncbi:beta-glucuronidase [Treponema zioleckii]|uniref:beta-glucuronidase n=1 Tax=Treponema zioleckii TaxID=331680 RepID=UPI00168BDC3F|nr:beta-glucuronidase [Treponema zioleckii]
MLYPVMTSSRLLCDLSGIWNFKIDKKSSGFDENWAGSVLSESRTIAVPASYNDLFDEAEIRDHWGWVFYQRNFSLPAFVRSSQRVVLRCDAVTHRAKVFVNGKLVCEHKGGFLPFEVELGNEVRDGENLLTIAVNNEIGYDTLPVGRKGGMFSGRGAPESHNEPNFDFFNYAGITRPVKIYTTPKSYINDIALWNEVSGTDAVVKYRVEVCGETDFGSACKVTLRDEEGRLVSESSGIEGILTVKNVRLWQPLNAYLYEVTVSFGEDVYTLPYGIRTVEVRGNKFLINGKAFYFKGYGKHEDTFPAGRGLNLSMNTKDISLMKWQGANSFRTSHYPYSEEMMRQCDREGLVVIDETPAVGLNFMFGGGANFGKEKFPTYDPVNGLQTREHHADVIRDWIGRDKNYACVVLWSIANEPDSYDKGAYDYFKPLFDLARSLDVQKRPCTLVSALVGGKPQDDVSLRLSDVFCINRYYGWYFGGQDLVAAEKMLREEMKFWKTTGKPLLMTEYGADTVAGFHDTVPSLYTEEYQVEFYKMNNRVLDECDFVAGEHVWNFADFATSQNMMRVNGNKKGIFTRERKPKLVAHYLKERWSSIPNFDYK